MAHKNIIDSIKVTDSKTMHAASIKYFKEVLANIEPELANLLLVQNPNNVQLKRIAKLKEIQKNCKHNLEITVMYSHTKRPYGL